MKSIAGSLVVLMAIPVMAANLDYRGRDRDRSPICERVRIEGVIAGIDDAAQQITVNDVTVQVTETTRIHMARKIFSFDDLAIGQTVAVSGVMDGDVLAAVSISVKHNGE